MEKGDFSNIAFQTFYVSKEESNCPLVAEIVRIGKRFKNSGLLENITTSSVSLKYGRRVLINANKSNIGDIKREDLLEIVDYDPVKKILLAMGTKIPKIETPVHWIIHHARYEVNAVIQINDKKLVKDLGNKFPVTKKDYPSGTLEQAKEVMKILRDSRIVVIINQGFLFVGNTIKEVEELVLSTYEELK